MVRRVAGDGAQLALQMMDAIGVADTLRKAVVLHRAGDLVEAARLYKVILSTDAKHIDADLDALPL